MIERYGNHEKLPCTNQSIWLLCDFNVESEDNSKAFEDALVDKLGKNDIKWEKDGFSNKSKIWVTYEEVINANAHQRPLQKKRGLETEWAVQQRDNQRYTLDMVRIDNKIREVVNQIKQEEAKLANLANKIEDAAPSVSVAT